MPIKLAFCRLILFAVFDCKLCQTGSFTLLDSYVKISEICEEYGTMELGEFKNYISDFAIENGKIYGYTQLNFF